MTRSKAEEGFFKEKRERGKKSRARKDELRENEMKEKKHKGEEKNERPGDTGGSTPGE